MTPPNKIDWRRTVLILLIGGGASVGGWYGSAMRTDPNEAAVGAALCAAIGAFVGHMLWLGLYGEIDE